MLENSTQEMKQTVDQLEKRIDSIDSEGKIQLMTSMIWL